MAFAIAAAFLKVTSSSATAAALLSSYSYVTGQTAYNVTPGQLVTVPVYLKETGTSLIASDGGLFGAGFSISEPVVTLNGSTLTGIGGNATTFPGGLSGNSPSNNATFLAEDSGTNINATSGPVPDSNGLIAIGTVSFTGGAAGSVTDFTLANYSAPKTTGGNTLTFDSSYDLDLTSTSPAYVGAASNPTTLVVTVAGGIPTPEPTGCAIVLVGAGMAMLNRGQNKRATT